MKSIFVYIMYILLNVIELLPLVVLQITFGGNGINIALCERTLHLSCVVVSVEQFSFDTENRIFRFTCTSCNKA